METRAQKGQKDEEESEGVTPRTEQPRVKKKRIVQRKVETSRHSARTLSVLQCMLEKGIT
jgi:hypothetical protein